jgi:hypothetical protein
MLATIQDLLSMYGKTSHIWEDSPYMGRLPIRGKSHTWEDFPSMGSLPIDGKFSHRVEVFPHVESLPIDEKVFPTYGKSSYIL